MSAFIEHYNWDRPHGAYGGLPPMPRIIGVNNPSAHNSQASVAPFFDLVYTNISDIISRSSALPTRP